MARWLVPGAGIAVIVAVAAVAGIVWARSGGTSADACDQTALMTSMRTAIADAEREGLDAIPPWHSGGCTPEDMMRMMTEVSRSWHVMPDGTMMRAGMHQDR